MCDKKEMHKMKYGIPEPTYHKSLKAAPHRTCPPVDPSLLKVEGFCNTFQTFEHKRAQDLGQVQKCLY